jgi:hypothetical protein
MRILILIETLRIGGIERNALDQAYRLCDRNEPGIILVFNKPDTYKLANFISAEKKLILEKKLDIRFSEPGLIRQLKAIQKIIKTEDVDLIIDYTLSGNIKVRAVSALIRKKVVLHCVVQQLASLSAPLQRYKRMFYAQFANKLFMNSVNYGTDWSYYINKNLITKFLFKKNFEIIRNGVYLPRLQVKSSDLSVGTPEVARFIFLGRLKLWKGINKFKNIDFALGGMANFLVIASDKDDVIVKKLTDLFGARIQFMFGKTLADFTPLAGDINIYPVEYGPDVPAIEAVSTNCLEMALLGVPSIVTVGGTDNWPEIRTVGLVQEVDWEKTSSILGGVARCRELSIPYSNFKNISNKIDIESNLNAHQRYLNL